MNRVAFILSTIAILTLSAFASSASAAPVRVFQHCGYGGYSAFLNEGSYDLHDLQARGVRNDDLSSLQVPPGYVVTIYEHAGFRGRSVRLNSSSSCLVQFGFNDRISSIVIRRQGGGYGQQGGPGPTVYQHCGFGGYGVRLREGQYNLWALQNLGVRNDDLSSVRVPKGYSITFFKHANFSGRSWTETYDNPCFANRGLNDHASSIIVRRRNYGPYPGQNDGPFPWPYQQQGPQQDEDEDEYEGPDPY
jgi:hypothetical protein